MKLIDVLLENEESPVNKALEAAQAMDKAIDTVDPSLGVKDFAKAVAIILKGEEGTEGYGTHNLQSFMEVLHAELGMNEGFTPASTRIQMGDKVTHPTSKFQGTADNLEDFLKAIDNIPDTAKSVTIDGQKFSASDKEGIKAKVKELTTDETDQFILRSYFGVSHKDDSTDPLYIDLRSERSRKHAADIGSGKYGRLD